MLLQAVRGSCALHGLHSPLRSAARTVASRCSQRVPRAAAAYTESYRVLQQDLADMDELLQAPRIKRAMARKQLELLAADAALLAFDVVAPQQYAALVAAQKELVAAQKELAASQKDVELAQMDAKILALDMKARAPVAALLSGSNRERGSGSGGSGIGGCSSPPSVTPCFERSRWCMTTCTAMAC